MRWLLTSGSTQFCTFTDVRPWDISLTESTAMSDESANPARPRERIGKSVQ